MEYIGILPSPYTGRSYKTKHPTIKRAFNTQRSSNPQQSTSNIGNWFHLWSVLSDDRVRFNASCKTTYHVNRKT